MEESSIRWGELIGGLLIIGCSLALVISLWSQIKGEPLLKFSVFVGMTAGLFGMGFYSAHRWKLPNTSRAALMISTLLVPLNFLAMTAFSQSAAPNSPLIIGGEILALLLFLFLVYKAGDVIVPGNSWLLTGATLAPSFAMLLAKHWHETHVATLSLSLAPMIAYWISTGVMMRGAKEKDEDGDRESNRIFTLFGIASFATVLPVGLLLIKSGNVTNSLHTFAPLLALLGVPAIASGLTLIRTNTGLSGKTRTAATSVAILGVMLAMAGLFFAWPWPQMLIGVALLNSLICAAIAWRFDLKMAHFAALVFFALAYLISANVLAGDFPAWSEDGARLINAFFSQTSGLAWMSLFVLFGVAAEAWRRAGRKTESRLYEFSAFCAAFFSLALLTWRGWGRAGDPQQLALVYLFFAVAAFIIARFRNRWIASWIGLCLSLLAVVQAFVFKFGYALAPHHPARLSLLVYASLAAVAAIVLNRAGGKAQQIFARPLTSAALFSSVAVSPFLLFGGWMTVGQMSVRMLWLAAIWLVLSVMNRWQVLFTAFQAALSVGVVCGVAAIFDSRVLPSHSSWLDPHLLKAEGIALALLSLSWLLLRIALRRADAKQSDFERLLYPSWLAVDHVGTVVVWGVLVALSFGVFSDGLIKAVTPLEWSETALTAFAIRAQGFGSWLLLLALALVFVVSLWEQFRKRVVLAMMTLLACACLLAAGNWRTSDSMFLSLRWLLVGGFAAVALPIIFRARGAQACERFRWPRMAARSNGLASMARGASLALFAAPALALTAILLDITPSGSFASFAAKAFFLAPLGIISLTLGAHAVRERSSKYALASGLMLNLAATLAAWLSNAKFMPVLHLNVTTLAIVALCWLAIDFTVMRRGKPAKFLRFHRPPARIAIAVMTFAVTLGWLAGLDGESRHWGLDWLALALLLLALIACLWDDESHLSWRGLSVAGLMTICLTFRSFHLAGHWLLAGTAAAFSLYGLVATSLWRERQSLRRFADAFSIPRRAGALERMWSWLVAGNALIAAFAAICAWVALFNASSLKLRLLVTTAAFALPLAFVLLACGAWRKRLIAVSIRLALLNLMLWSWAWLVPPTGGGGLQVINRLASVMLIAEAVLLAYRFIAIHQLPAESEWRRGLRDELWWVAVAGLSSLVLVLSVELSNYSLFGIGLTSAPVIAAVLVTLIGLVFLGLAFAILPGEDPFGLNERKRMRYVYAAEGFMVLTLMHVRVTMPWLFGGTFTRYWPLLVMGIAFAGVGLSELFRRQGKVVLAEPLERTGIFLPLLPVIGFWASGSQISYSMLLLLVGLFYGWLSVIRRSFRFGLLAALAGNCGLWHFLHGELGFGFSEHPQLWLIPAALSVLLAARINRDSLSAEQMSSIRYASLIVIYVSSTADIFLNGVDDSPWLPIVLAVLSVGGVMAGIMLRIRSFLFLGTAFLLLSMLTMIWSASVNLHWTWLWSVMGIALGVFIIYSFAMFERKRQEMLAFVARLKQWQ